MSAGIPNHDLHRLVDVLVGDRLREDPGSLTALLGGALMVGDWGPVDLDPQNVATLARIASGEAYQSAGRKTQRGAS